jgi:hypothetical protein
MPESKVLRIGAGTVEVDAYGGSFASATDLKKTSEDGITIEYSVDKKMVPSAQDITIEEIFMISESLTMKFALKEHTLENLAYSFGHPTSDVVDDAVSSPKNRSLIFGGRRTFTPVAIRIKTLIPDSTTLYDHLILFRAIFVPAFSQVMTIKNERYVPCELNALGDSSNSGKLGKVISEYV